MPAVVKTKFSNCPVAAVKCDIDLIFYWSIGGILPDLSTVSTCNILVYQMLHEVM